MKDFECGANENRRDNREPGGKRPKYL